MMYTYNQLDLILMIIKYLLNLNYGCGTKTNDVFPTLKQFGVNIIYNLSICLSILY